MHYNYLKNKPEMTMAAWNIMEDTQDAYRYQEFGWCGFIIMIIRRKR